ncbi:hypothetical protein N7481_008803 [Penicillium waksmanii]|uniref:uncharacterized protein n=1 Tax=Penicillium waksmanii TaxID=69791 RepID=UPI002548FB9E|nr:uncharacterized protein N7481_008803 [Penicillium waksmanii]KAJ5975096.1 hypothetical protein N7481_008803 [Penicillium waksmanii]
MATTPTSIQTACLKSRSCSASSRPKPSFKRAHTTQSSPEPPPPHLLHEKLTLPSGRTLGYAIYNSQLAPPQSTSSSAKLETNPPKTIIYFHGYPSSRLEGLSFTTWPKKHNFTLIVPDRPGFGLSTPDPSRTILSWANDIRALGHHLRLPSFYILGCSGGGPYAISCAHALSGDMLLGVGVIAGSPPWYGVGGKFNAKDVTLSRRILAWGSVSYPGVIRWVADGILGGLRWVVKTEFVGGLIDRWIEGVKGLEQQRQSSKGENTGSIASEKANASSSSSPEERDYEKQDSLETDELSITRARNHLLSSSLEAFTQGSHAAIQEARLLSQPWGFELEDVRYEGIKIWHGVRDINAPISMVRAMVERLPASTVFKDIDADHYSMGHFFEDALVGLLDSGWRTSEEEDRESKTSKGMRVEYESIRI